MFAEVNSFFNMCRNLKEAITKRPELQYKPINLNDISTLTDCLETAVNSLDRKIQEMKTRISVLENSVLEKQNGAVENEIQEQGEEQPLKKRRGRRAIKDVTVPVD